MPDEGLVGRYRDQRHHAAADRRRCRRSATPISPFASPAAPPPSISAAAPSRSRPGASSPSPTACSRCRTRILKPAAAHAPASASTARCRRRPKLLASDALARQCRARARSGDEPRHRRRAGHARSAARHSDVPPDASTYAITADLSNFAADKMLIGQKVEAAVAAGDRDQRRLPDQGRRQDQRHAGHHRSAASRRATPTPNCTCRRRSTRPRAAGSASISAAPSPAPSRSSSPAASAATSRTTASIVEADLTPVEDRQSAAGLGQKPAGKPAHATFTLIKTAKGDALRRSGDRRVAAST